MEIALAGYGQEGEASYSYWKLQGANITIFDEKEPSREIPEEAKTYFGADAFSKMNGFDLIIRTAGLNPNKISTDSKVWSATNEFFKNCPAEIIGVTGTKGKGTTASLITKILEAAGKKAHLLGNIGVPALSQLPKIDPTDVVVFELSSFQLWDLERSPQTAVVLMIEPDHMDIHASMAEYIDAKANIGKFQTEDNLLVYHPSNAYSAEIASVSFAQKRRYMTPEGAHVTESNYPQNVIPANAEISNIVIEENVVCTTKEVGLLGSHNLENICAAITAAWNYTQDISAIQTAVKSFKGLPHRLEFAGEVDGVKFYNDSQATGTASTLAAMRSFTESTVLILGGSDKGLDISKVIDELDESRHFVILLGQSSQKIESALLVRNFSKYVNLGTNTDMKVVVATAFKHAQNGEVVLLSPAHASFDMFTNYQERGDLFKQAVKLLQNG